MKQGAFIPAMGTCRGELKKILSYKTIGAAALLDDVNFLGQCIAMREADLKKN